MNHYIVTQLIVIGLAAFVFVVQQHRMGRLRRADQPIPRALRFAQVLAIAGALVGLAGIALDIFHRV